MEVRPRYTQPALLTHSYACLQVFRELTENRLKPVIAAGHSLGEYSALVAANVLSFESALKLVQRRGELMGEYGEGEMTAFPLDLETIRPIAERYHCAVAGCNLPDQTVIGGRGEDLASAEQEVKDSFARKRPVRLKTEGAFHTYYMVKAAQHFRAVLEAAEFGVEQAEAGVEEAEEQLAKTIIRAPMSGKVTRLNVEEGETAIIGGLIRDDDLEQRHLLDG